MLKTTSANRATRMKVIEDGKVVKTISNASINYGQDLVQLKKMIEIAIRLSPDDPIYTVEKLIISAGDGAEYEIDQKELELIQSTLFRPDTAVPVGAKIQLTVHVKRPAQRSVSRSGATMRERMTSSTAAKEEVPPASSKYENLLRAPSPAPSRRTSTPSKVRSVSRGRVTTTPGNNFRGPSPARFSRCSVSSNDSDNTSRVANRLRDVIPDGMIGRMGSQDSFGSTRSEKFEPSLRVPSTETKMVNNPPSSASKPPPVPQSVESKNTMPPPAPANEPKPATIEPFPESLNDKKTPVKSKRLSVVDLTEENRKNIEMSIHQTWKEVESAPGVKTPPRSFLGPFSYYSPMMSPANQEDDYVSCAGDMGADDHHPMTISATDLPTVDEASNVEETLNTSAQDISEITEAPDSLENTENTSEVANEASSKTNSSSTTANNGTPKKVAPNSAMKSKKSFIQSNVASASKPKNPSNRTSQVGAGAIRPVFPDGKTLGESASSYDHSLRSYSGVNRLTHSEMKKPVSKNDFSPPFAKGHRRTGSFHKDSHKDGEGRPSIGTITTQWEFMRINFLNNSDEELEWLMVSKKTGAYHYAHKKLENGEDKYFKSLYEIDLYENRLQVFVPTNAKFSVLLQDLSNYYSAIMAQPKDETTGNQVLASYQKLCNYCEEVKSQDLFTIFTPKFNQSLSALLLNSNENNDKFKLVRKARDLYSLYTTEITMVQNKLIQSRKDSEESLKNIEKWTKREVETDEYLTVMKQQEQVFMEKEFDENYRSLQLMRSYYPNPSTTTDNKSINEMTITELQQEYQLQGGLISYELANELKSNKFLQWIITHPDDIVYANFLNGDKKTYFENLETYDLIELRAISMILPSKFENDNDNKKMEWRNRFMTRLKMLISQYHGEKVKGCWDGANNCRSMVQLPALKPDQLRRSIYYYRTKEQSDVKLKQYNDKLALLEKKKKQLEQAEMEAKEAKEEYNTVLQEMRDPDFLDLYGSEKLASVKDLAKTELNNAEKKRKTLQQDVTRLEKSIEDTPMSRDQFIEKEKELQDYLKEVKEIDWTVPGTAPVLIDGVFEPDRVIEKQVKAAAKFLSAEEEAEQRRLELLSFKAKSVNGNSIDTESVDAESAVSPTPEITLAAPSTASQSVDDMISNQNDILNTLTNENNAPVTPMANPLTSPTRKTSILTSTNPDLINTLNKMLSGATKQDTPTGSSILRPKSVSRRSTMGAIFNRTASASSEDTNSENSAANSLPKEKKTTKSKLLKRLLQPFGSKAEGDSENSNPNKALARPPMSFLDQIKARASGKPAQAATASEESEVSTSAEPPMMKPKNPMFAAFGGGGGEGMSFLDQIKSRRKVEE